MSATQDIEIRGPEECSVFDPTYPRTFSILPDADAGEAYCVRHDHDMEQIDPVVHRDGALYTTVAHVSTYTCPHCLAEASSSDGTPARLIYRAGLQWAFSRWDDGNAEGDWFRYLGEGGPEDVRGVIGR